MQERGRGLAEQAEMVHNMGEQDISNMGQDNVHKQWYDCQMFTILICILYIGCEAH